MSERQHWKRSANRGIVLLLGLGAVSGAGHWSYNETIPYMNGQLGDDREQIRREHTLTDDLYIGMMARVGIVASRCFSEAGGRGISRVVPVSGDDRPMVIFRPEGNESIDIKAMETCIYEQSEGLEVHVSLLGDSTSYKYPSQLEAVKQEFEKHFGQS